MKTFGLIFIALALGSGELEHDKLTTFASLRKCVAELQTTRAKYTNRLPAGFLTADPKWYQMLLAARRWEENTPLLDRLEQRGGLTGMASYLVYNSLQSCESYQATFAHYSRRYFGLLTWIAFLAVAFTASLFLFMLPAFEVKRPHAKKPLADPARDSTHPSRRSSGP